MHVAFGPYKVVERVVMTKRRREFAEPRVSFDFRAIALLHVSRQRRTIELGELIIATTTTK